MNKCHICSWSGLLSFQMRFGMNSKVTMEETKAPRFMPIVKCRTSNASSQNPLVSPFHWMRNYYLMSWYKLTWGRMQSKQESNPNKQKAGTWWGPNEDLILFHSISSPSFRKKIWRSVNILPTIPYQIFLMQNKIVQINLLIRKISTHYSCAIYNRSFLLLIGLYLHFRTSTRPTQYEEPVPFLD